MSLYVCYYGKSETLCTLCLCESETMPNRLQLKQILIINLFKWIMEVKEFLLRMSVLLYEISQIINHIFILT